MTGESDTVRAAALRRDVGRRMALCNLDEARVVDRVLQRLELGRDRYGHLDLAQPRNWRKERCEERLDALVYDVCEELASEDIERARIREDARHELIGRGQAARIAIDDVADDDAYDELEIEFAGMEPS